MPKVCSILKACLKSRKDYKKRVKNDVTLCCKGAHLTDTIFVSAVLPLSWEKKQIFIPTPWFVSVACIVSKYLLCLQTHCTLVSASF